MHCKLRILTQLRRHNTQVGAVARTSHWKRARPRSHTHTVNETKYRMQHKLMSVECQVLLLFLASRCRCQTQTIPPFPSPVTLDNGNGKICFLIDFSVLVNSSVSVTVWRQSAHHLGSVLMCRKTPWYYSNIQIVARRPQRDHTSILICHAM